jgi:hypothetical protein
VTGFRGTLVRFSSRRIALLTTAVLSVGLYAPAAAHAAPPTHPVAGDIDGDGRADLVVASAHSIAIFYTGGLGRQDIAVKKGFISGVATGDFNGDGFADVAVGDSLAFPDSDGLTDDGAVYVWYGGPSGLGSRTMLRGPVGKGDGFGGNIETVDINGDHRDDLAVVDDNGYTYIKPRLIILLGNAGGLSKAHALHLGRQHRSAIAVGDLNGDGHPDLVVGRPDTGKELRNDDGEVDVQEGTLAIYYGKAHGLSTKPQVVHGLPAGVGYGALGTSLAIARINHDRYADIVAGAPSTSLDAHGHIVRKFSGDVEGSIVVLYGSRHGIHTKRHSVVTIASPGVPVRTFDGDDFGEHVAAGDLNGDGHADVIAERDQEFNGRDGSVYIFRSAASGITTNHVQQIRSHKLGDPHHKNYEAMLYGSALSIYRPTTSSHAWLAIGAPGYIKSQNQWLGFVDLFPSTSAGLTTSGAQRIFGTVDQGYFGGYLAP